MATEGEIPEPIPTMKSEGEITYSANQFDSTVGNSSPVELKKFQGVLNTSPQIFEHLRETKNTQATNAVAAEATNTIKKCNVEILEGERFLESPSAVQAAFEDTCNVSKTSNPEEVTHQVGNEMVEDGKQMQNNEQVEVEGETGTVEKKVVEESAAKPEKNGMSNDIVNLTGTIVQMVKIEESNLMIEEESLKEERIIDHVEVIEDQHFLDEDKSNEKETSDIHKHEKEGTVADANIDLQSNKQVPNILEAEPDQNKEALIHMMEPMGISLNKNVETVAEPCNEAESIVEFKFEEEIGETNSNEAENKEAEKSIIYEVTEAAKPSERAADEEDKKETPTNESAEQTFTRGIKSDEEVTLKIREGDNEIKPSVSPAIDVSSVQEAGSEAGEKIEEASSISYGEKPQDKIEPSKKMECMTQAEDALEDKDNVDTSAMQTEETPLQQVDNTEPLKVVPKIRPDDVIKEGSDEIKERIEMFEKAEENDSSSNETGKDNESPEIKEDDLCVKQEGTLSVNEVLPTEEASSGGNRNEEEGPVTMTKDNIYDIEIINASQHSQSGMSNNEERPENLQQNEPEKEEPEASLNVLAKDFKIAAETEYAETITSIKEEAPIKIHEESFEEEIKGELQNQKDVNVPLIESNEKTECAEVEVPNKNPNDLHVIHAMAEEAGQDESKNVNEVSKTEPIEIIQESYKSKMEEEKHIEDAPETCQSTSSTILEHASIEGAETTELIPRAIETDIKKPQEASGIDYEENSMIMDNGENTDHEVQKNRETCDAVGQEMLANSYDAEKCVTDAEASVEVNGAAFLRDEKVEQDIQVESLPEAATQLIGQDESTPDAGKCKNDAEASVEVSSAAVVKDEKVEQNIQVESPVRIAPELTTQDESCIAEENDKMGNITNEEVHDGMKITDSVEAINEQVIEGNVKHNSPEMIEKQEVESFEGDKNMVEKSDGEHNGERVTKDSNIRCPGPESIEQIPVNNLKDEEKKPESSTVEILENAETAEAADSTAHETIKDIESPKEILDGCVAKHGESLESGERKLTPTETSPEEKSNEHISTSMVTEEKGGDLEPVDAKDNENKASKSEEDLKHISQKNEPGEELPESLTDISDKNEVLNSDADKISGDTDEVLSQNLEEAVQKEENEKKTEEENDTEYNKIAAQEDLEKVAEMPDASKTQESIDVEPRSEMDKMMVKDETKEEESRELHEDSNDGSKYEETEKCDIKEECGTTDILQEPVGEETLQSSKEEEKEETSKIEACEELEATSLTEAAGKQTLELEMRVDQSTELEEEKFEQSIQEDEPAAEMSKQGNDIDISPLSIEQERLDYSEGSKNKAEKSEEENKREQSEEESHGRGIIPESVELSPVKNLEDDKEKSEKSTEEIFESSETPGAVDSTVNGTSTAIESSTETLDASLVKQGDSLQNEEKHLTATESLLEEKGNGDRGLVMVAEHNSNSSELLAVIDDIENKPSIDEADLQHTAENEPEEKHEQLLSVIPDEIEALSSVTDRVPCVMEGGTSQNVDEAPKTEQNDEQKEERNDPKDNRIEMEEIPEVVAEPSDASKRTASIVLEVNSEKDKMLVQDEIKNEESEEVHEDSENVGKCDIEKHNTSEECIITDILPEPIEEKAPQSFEEEEKEEEKLKTVELETTNVGEDADKQTTEKEKTVEQSIELEIERVDDSSQEDDMAEKTSKQEECEITQIANEEEDTGKQDQEKGGAPENFEVSEKGTDDSLTKENEEAEHEKQAFDAAASSTSIETEETVHHTKQGIVSSSVEEETVKESSKEDESELEKLKEEIDDSNLFIEKTEATSSTKETVYETLTDREESNVNSSPLDITRESEAETPPKVTDGCPIEESATVSHTSNKETEEEIKEKEDTSIVYSDPAPITVVTEEKGLQETEPEDKKPVDSFAPAFEEKYVAAIETEKTMLESLDINVKAEDTSNMDNKRDNEIPTVVDKAKEIDGGLIEDSAVLSHTPNKEAEEEIKEKEDITVDDLNSASVTEVTEEKGFKETEPADKTQVDSYPPAFEEKDVAEESVDISVKPEYTTELGEKWDNETSTVAEKAREKNGGLIEESDVVSNTSNKEAEEEIKDKEETTINDTDSACITVVSGEKGLQETEPEGKKQVDSFAPTLEEKDKAEIETNKTMLESLYISVKPEEALNLGERDNEIPTVADETTETNGGLIEESAMVSHTSKKETEEEIKEKEETLVNDSDTASVTMVTEEKGLQPTEPEKKEQVDSFAPTPEEEDIAEIETKNTMLENVDIQTKPEDTSDLCEKRENEIPTVTEDAREKIDSEIQKDVPLAGSEDQIEVNSNNVESSNLELQMEKTEDERPFEEALKTFETSVICTESEKPILKQEISQGNLKEVVEAENTEIEQKGEAHSQRHGDTNNKDIGILTEEKLECASEVVVENQTNETVPESDKSQIEKISSNNQNQEDDKEIKEKEDLQLETDEYKEQNAIETIKAVILTEKEPEGIEQSNDSGDIKQLVVEEESGINELHASSTLIETTDEMENSTPLCSEYNEAAELKEETRTENAEIGEDLAEETEASLSGEPEEQKARAISVEPDVNESQEKTAETVEESQDDYNKIDDAALTTMTDASAEEAQLSDKLVKNFTIEEAETENSQQSNEIDSMKLEETSALVSKLPVNNNGHAESENITIENRDVGEPEESKIASDTVFESKDQGAEEVEVGKSQTLEKQNQVPTNDDDHVGRENAAVETSGADEARGQRHEDTNNKDNEILTEIQIEESSNYNQNQGDEKEKKEKVGLQLEAEEHKEQNANETTKAVILTKKEQEGVEQSNDSEDIKQLVVEEECSINELHVSSTVHTTTDEMENSAPVCSEYNGAADLKEEIKTEKAEIEEDSTREKEASLARESEAQKTHDTSIEPDLKEPQEKTTEIFEESQDKYNKIDDATLTTKTDTSFGEAEQDDKLVKDLHIEATETENSHQDKEVDNMKLEETSELASEIQLNENDHAESESIATENRGVGVPGETKIAYEAALQSKGQGAEKYEVAESQTVEKPDQVPTDNDDHAGRENAAMENSGAQEVEEAEIVSIAIDETNSQGTGDTAETGKSPTLEKEDQILTSDREHTHKECLAVENPKVDELKEIKAVPDAFYESKYEGIEESDGKSSTVKSLDQVPATFSEHAENERVIVEKLDAEEVEEITIASDTAYTSKDQSNENINETEKNSSEENVDADKTEEASDFRVQGIEPVKENSTTADQTPSADAQLPTPTFILPSKNETATTVEKIEEEKPQEENLEDENLEKERESVENLDAEEVEEPKIVSNVSYKSEDHGTEDIDENGKTPSEKPDADKIEEASRAAPDYRAQGVEPVTEDETTADQTSSTEKVNAPLPLPTPTSTLPSENETTAIVEKIEEKKPKVGKLEDEVLEDSSAAKPTEEIGFETEGSRELEVSTLGFRIDKDIHDSPTEVYKKEGQTPDGALQLEPRENEDKATNTDSSSQNMANIDITEPTAKACNLQFETSEKPFQSESVIQSHEDPTDSEDVGIKEKHLTEAMSYVKLEENQCKNTSEENEITENEVSKEEIKEEKEVAKTHPPISLGEETTNKSLEEAGLKAEECKGDETNNAFKTTVNEIQYEEIAVETEKAIREQIAAKDRSVEDSDQESVDKKNTKESFPHLFEVKDVQESNFESGKEAATTPRDKESSMDILQKESDKPRELIQETQELKESSCETTEKQILTEVDLVQRIDTVVQTGSENVPPMLQEGIKETQAEAGDLKPGNAEGVLSEAKVNHGGEQSRDYSPEETNKESALMDSAKHSLSDLLQRSRKETSEMARHVSKETEPTASTEEDQIEKPESIQVKEAKLHEEKKEEEGDEHNTDSTSDAPVMVEASKDMDVKAAQKKSHNILSGVGSKVKHSISKVKKAITGKSSHSKPVSPK